ncbi:ATP-binding protein [Metapseudomonas furukawaii]|uniref:ATP-binding protein n=1 Tax=Metapseudomonas furukawaii TaxID=1149133 RepID=A0AAD1BZD9_METFU|nr:ATP-binding protein [Pseudomonas furukawaii]ELS27936.1 hypothetical protein ppKF707_0549 [Pseudomonas furukawaii]BAU73083.1 putative ATP-binding protein [Pseudomonas furukawaii]
MRVLSFKIPGGEGEVSLPEGDFDANRVTILLGENGTRKSTLLRAILDDSIVDPEQKRRQRYPSAFSYKVGEPSQVIAISAIPNDRFPTKKRSGDSRVDGRYSAENYEYIGPRHNQNIVSRNQSLQALAAAALQNSSPSIKVSSFIRKLSGKTGVPLHYHMEVQPVFSMLRGDLRTRDGVHRLSEIPAEEIGKVNFLVDTLGGRSSSTALSLSIDISGGVECNDYELEAIQVGYKYGLVNLRPPSKKGSSADGAVEGFSAGQWGLFSTLATLALRAKDNSLILIDEPESALHPRWQREYMGDLMEAMSECAGCHVFLATHSPLIVGTAGSGEFDLLILRKDNNGKLVSEISDVPVGWQSNDVLEEKFSLVSTRSPELVDQLEEILKLVASGLHGKKTKLRHKLEVLKPIVEGLPEEDSLRALYLSLNRLVK